MSIVITELTESKRRALEIYLRRKVGKFQVSDNHTIYGDADTYEEAELIAADNKINAE